MKLLLVGLDSDINVFGGICVHLDPEPSVVSFGPGAEPDPC